MVIFVCQDNHQPRGQQRTHAFRTGGGGYRGKTAEHFFLFSRICKQTVAKVAL
jgi:hypothetical protein